MSLKGHLSGTTDSLQSSLNAHGTLSGELATTNSLSGELTTSDSLNGELNTTTPNLDGTLQTVGTLSGALLHKVGLLGGLSNELLRGYSAYQVAVLNGFEGTVNEWLESLKGEQGVKGEQGDPFTYEMFTDEQLATLKGDKGDKGDIGSPFTYNMFTSEQLEGLKGPKGDKGTPFTYDMFTSEQLESLRGPQGEAGKDGVDGYTPIKGADYWTTSDKQEIINETKDAIDLSSYALRDEIPTDYAQKEHTHDEYSLKDHKHNEYLTEHQSLEGYAKITDIPTDYAKINHEHSEYLTEHQDLSNYSLKKDVPTKTSQLTNDSGFITKDDIPEQEVVDLSDYFTKSETEATVKTYTDTKFSEIIIPDELADLKDDSTHRVVTDIQISDWDAKSNFSGSYTDLINTPTLGSLAAKNTVAKTDLASDVQTSLDKADTALQSFTETDPTVPAWAKTANKPSYTASEVGLGNVENKSSATIRGELTKENVTNALGYTPPQTDTTYSVATQSDDGLMSATDKGNFDTLYASIYTDLTTNDANTLIKEVFG